MCISKFNTTMLSVFKFPVTNENERFMGSTVILCNKNGEKIYKLLKNGNFNELEFYKSIKRASILYRHKIIPKFLKVVKLFKIETQPKNSNANSNLAYFRRFRETLEHSDPVFAIEMRNFLYGYANPSIMDLKLGTSWIGESQADPIYNLRRTFIKLFPENHHIEYLEKIVSRVQSNTQFDMSSTFIQKIKYLAKSFKQQMLINNSSQYELGIRIQGLIADEISISRQKGKELSAIETMSYISQFLKLSPNLMKLTRKKIFYLKSWLFKQKKYRFIATSLVLTFDR